MTDDQLEVGDAVDELVCQECPANAVPVVEHCLATAHGYYYRLRCPSCEACGRVGALFGGAESVSPEFARVPVDDRDHDQDDLATDGGTLRDRAETIGDLDDAERAVYRALEQADEPLAKRALRERAGLERLAVFHALESLLEDDVVDRRRPAAGRPPQYLLFRELQDSDS